MFGDDYKTHDGSCVRDYIHVIDLADAHLKALEYITEYNKSITLNLGTGRGYSVKEVINIAQKIADKRVTQKIVARRDGEVADNTKAKSILGWSPRYDMGEIITSAYEWHKKGKI